MADVQPVDKWRSKQIEGNDADANVDGKNIELVSKTENVVDADEKSEDVPNKNCCFKIVFVDMLEDLVRDRGITVLAVMFLLTLTVFSTNTSFQDDNPYVELLNFASPPQYLLTIGTPSGRTPRLHAFMSDSSLPGFCADPESTLCPKIKATIVDVVTVNNEYSLDCSRRYLEDVKGTLEGERLEEVCSVSVENGVAKTDSKGLASFPDFTIHGPEGKYTLNFAVDDALLNFTIEMANPVVAIFLKSGFLDLDNMFFDVGVPFPVQPTIQVTKFASFEGPKLYD